MLELKSVVDLARRLLRPESARLWLQPEPGTRRRQATRPHRSGRTGGIGAFRVRYDRVDKAGKVTLRHNSRLHHIGIGRPHAGTPIVMLIHNLQIRIIHAATGEIIRHLTLDPNRRYQPTGNKRGGPSRPYGPRKNKKPEP